MTWPEQPPDLERIFAVYETSSGELTRDELGRVLEHSWSQPDYETAHKALAEFSFEGGYGVPPLRMVCIAANIIGTLGERVPKRRRAESEPALDNRWLYVESLIIERAWKSLEQDGAIPRPEI